MDILCLVCALLSRVRPIVTLALYTLTVSNRNMLNMISIGVCSLPESIDNDNGRCFIRIHPVAILRGLDSMLIRVLWYARRLRDEVRL